MPENANAPGLNRGAAVRYTRRCAAKHSIKSSPIPPEFQDRCWRAFQLSVEVDLAERSAESWTLRTIAHRVWSVSFLADGRAA